MTKIDYLKEGFKYFGQQDYSSAELKFLNALELDPNFDLALNALCEVYNKSGRLNDALEIAKRLLKVAPEDPLAHAAISRIYMQKGMILEAEDEMDISNRLASKS